MDTTDQREQVEGNHYQTDLASASVGAHDGSGTFTLRGRSNACFNTNTGQHSALNDKARASFLASSSVDDLDFTFLMWFIRNSAHGLLSTEELKGTFAATRGVRNEYAGHASATRLTYNQFYCAMSILLAFVRDIDTTFPGIGNCVNGMSFEGSFRAAMYQSLFKRKFDSMETKRLLDECQTWAKLAVLQTSIQELKDMVGPCDLNVSFNMVIKDKTTGNDECSVRANVAGETTNKHAGFIIIKKCR